MPYNRGASGEVREFAVHITQHCTCHKWPFVQKARTPVDASRTVDNKEVYNQRATTRECHGDTIENRATQIQPRNDDY